MDTFYGCIGTLCTLQIRGIDHDSEFKKKLARGIGHFKPNVYFFNTKTNKRYFLRENNFS